MTASPTSPADRAPHITPSKTQLKRQMHALQNLGQALADLSADHLAAMPIEERLREAIDMLRRTRSHEGRRRQLQFVGKLMRQADAQPIREALAALELGSAQDTLRLHRIEHWRQELVASDEAITRWAAAHPDTDVKRLRDLARAARTDALTPAEQRHGRAWRELFRFLKPHVDAGEAA